ncbi:hypothetical protein J2T56_000334 [Natronobacillus azotifigens]|uniref:Uncharacterized protein n=1 Tax=Natronobacillus azotifigens TaxID=472978 RepID=A0A9J6R9A6_9BACI|nr:hypothetical protein [Natronobacillus azotifigens]MCZ0701891.1 hypothetical protein [Natronobacillus azotifigens]
MRDIIEKEAYQMKFRKLMDNMTKVDQQVTIKIDQWVTKERTMMEDKINQTSIHLTVVEETQIKNKVTKLKRFSLAKLFIPARNL